MEAGAAARVTSIFRQQHDLSIELSHVHLSSKKCCLRLTFHNHASFTSLTLVIRRVALASKHTPNCCRHALSIPSELSARRSKSSEAHGFDRGV